MSIMILEELSRGAYATPEVVAPAVDVDYESGGVTLTIGGIQARSMTLYDHTHWTSDGLENFVPPAVNDDDLGNPAFTWKIGAGTSRLVFDAGAGNAPGFVECRVSIDTTFDVTSPSFEYSDDGVAWTPIAIEASWQIARGATVDGRVIVTFVFTWASVGEHRFWRASRPAGTAATVVTQVWFRELSGNVIGADEGWRVRVYDARSATRELLAEVSGANILRPVRFAGAITTTRSEETTTYTVVVDVVAVDSDGRESEGVRVAAASQVSVPASDLFVIDGDNENVVVPDTDRVIAIAGPTAAFAIDGFSSDRDAFTIYNATGFTLTVKHDGPGATFGNAVKMLSGVDLTATSPSALHFQRLTAESCWIFVYGRNATGPI